MKISRFSKFGISFSLITIFWLYLFAASIHAVLPDNPISSFPLEKQLRFPTWFPQGWGFFSKDPRDSYFSVIDMEEQKLAPDWPNNVPENLFGLKRLGRSQGIEAGVLYTKLSEDAVEKCEADPYSCLKDYGEPVKLDNPSPNPALCGDIGFVHQEPVPWAWSKGKRNIEMPSKVVRVNISCSKK